eukprot:5687973-Pyramimonas_sp.AAC.1
MDLEDIQGVSHREVIEDGENELRAGQVQKAFSGMADKTRLNKDEMEHVAEGDDVTSQEENEANTQSGDDDDDSAADSEDDDKCLDFHALTQCLLDD